MDDVPNRLHIIAMPCCRKPVHGRCLKPLVRARAHCPTCPQRRSLLTRFGWFGPAHQGQIRNENIVGEGVVPCIRVLQGAPRQPRANEPPRPEQQQTEEVMESWLETDYAVLVQQSDDNVGQWDANRASCNLRIQDYSENDTHDEDMHGDEDGEDEEDEDSAVNINRHVLGQIETRPPRRVAHDLLDEDIEQVTTEVDKSLVTPETPVAPKLIT